MSNFIERINKFCLGLEGRFGLFFASFIIAIVIVGFDMLYITPLFEPNYHGNYFATLSTAPFDFSYSNPLRNRILPSLLGYLLFLRGDLFYIFLLIGSLSFVTCIYYVYRKKKFSGIDSLLFTGLIAFSSTLLVQLASPGYTDVFLYFFVFLTFVFVRNKLLSALFFSLALLTHESAFFLFPGLVLYSWYLSEGNKWNALEYAMMLILASAPLVFYRIWVSKYVAVEFDVALYFSKENIRFCVTTIAPLLPVGALYVFKLFWFFPIYVLFKTFRKKEFLFFSMIATILICDFAQLIIAYDVTRMLCLGFPAILLAAEKVRLEWDAQQFTRFLFILTVVNFLLMQFYVSADNIIQLLPFPVTLFSQ